MNTKILHQELSYALQGCVFQIRNEYGSGHKELIYQSLLCDFLKTKGIVVFREKRVSVYSNLSHKVIGFYQPDLIVDEKIIVEIKATRITTKQNKDQLVYYLRNTVYEVGYLINFGCQELFMQRFILTNDRKPFRVDS